MTEIAKRTEHHRDVECKCATPLPELGIDSETPSERQYGCTLCQEDLNTDSDGNAYRRLPGDLDTPEQRKGRIVLQEARAAEEEIRTMVRELPEREQRRLLKMPRRQFDRVAKIMLQRRAKILEAEAARGGAPVPMGPNARRRAARRQAELEALEKQIAEEFEPEASEDLECRGAEIQIVGVDPGRADGDRSATFEITPEHLRADGEGTRLLRDAAGQP